MKKTTIDIDGRASSNFSSNKNEYEYSGSSSKEYHQHRDKYNSRTSGSGSGEPDEDKSSWRSSKEREDFSELDDKISRNSSGSRYPRSDESRSPRYYSTRQISSRTRAERDRDRSDDVNNVNNDDEDLKISKLVRQLAKLESLEKFINTCLKIEELIRYKENRKYLQRSLNLLVGSLGEVIRSISGVTWKKDGISRYALFLSKIVDAMESQFVRVYNWLSGLIERNSDSESVRRSTEISYTVQALFITMIPHLTPKQINALNSTIHSYFEQIEIISEFKIYCSILLRGLLNDKEYKLHIFQDFTDFVIGWLVDFEQSEETYTFCIGILNELNPYFKRDPSFTMILLTQFVEDIQFQLVERSEDDEEYEDLNTRVKKVSLFSRAYTTIITLNCVPDKKFVSDSVERFVSSVLKFLEVTDSTTDSNTTIIKLNLINLTNKCIIFRADGLSVILFLKKQLAYIMNNENWKTMCKPSMVEFFCALGNWIEFNVNQSSIPDEVVEIVESILKLLTLISPFLNTDDHELYFEIVQPLSKTRNVELLQMLYNWVIEKLELDEESKVQNKDPVTILHVLLSLKEIACSKTNSIFTLWTLTPTIFDLLMNLIEDENQIQVVKLSALNILKAHFLSHSHFVPSLVTSNVYMSDSPGIKYLPSIMKFWLKQLDFNNTPLDIWTMNWIIEFIKTSSNYAQFLFLKEPKFYQNFINQASSNPNLQLPLCELLEWMISDANYCDEELVLNAAKNICLEFLLRKEKLDPKCKEILIRVLKSIPALIVTDRCILADEHNFNPEEKVDISWIEKDIETLTIAKINTFLDDLLEFQDDSLEVKDKYSRQEIRGVVDYLIKSKLRTTIGGKAHEFFGKLQLLFKKYTQMTDLKEYGFPNWKLDFIFELEKRIVNCIHGSVIMKNNLPEPLKTFFLTNKVPCTEWMKRMRQDIIEISGEIGYSEMGYFYSSLSGEKIRTKEFLFEFKDKEGLKGWEEMSAFYCLNENYELALTTLAKEEKENTNDSFYKTIKMKCELGLGKWDGDLDTLFSNLKLNGVKQTEKSNLLDLQLSCSSPKKKNLEIPFDEFELSIETIHKVEEYFNKNAENTNLMNQDLKLMMGRKMLQKNNFNFVKNWLSTSVFKMNQSMDLKDFKLSNLDQDIIVKNPQCFQVLSDLLYVKGDKVSSMKGYSIISDLIEKENILSSNERALFYIDFANKVYKEDQEFFNNLISETNIPYDTDEKTQFLLDLHQSSINFDGGSKAWFSYGEITFNLSKNETNLDIKESLQTLSFQSYSQFLNYFNSKKQRRNSNNNKPLLDKSVNSSNDDNSQKITAMINLIKLIDDGQKFKPKELLISKDWVSLLLFELSKHEELRKTLFEKFPAETAFYFAAFEKNTSCAPYKMRRFKNSFETNGYVLMEINDEKYNPVCQNRNCGEMPDFQNNVINQKPNMISDDIKLIIRELQRVGTSPEEFWTCNFHKVNTDWYRRYSALKRDNTRELNKAKIRLYMSPIVKQIELYWNETMNASTLQEMAFIHKHKNTFEGLLKKLSSFESLEEMSKTYEKLTILVESFSISSISRLSLAHLSPVLANYNFNSSQIPLPGSKLDTHISSIDPVVICLATKTKPKRLKFRATNGKMYEYLVKGNENLNIDMGVMEFMKVSQEFLGFPLRIYSVTPLGTRGGLIQIVEEAMPIFLVYKKFLQRNDSVEKTSEMFWKRMEALDCNDRSNLSIVKKVFDQLVGETPSELISREFVLASKDPFSWYKINKTFTRDTALGSAIGYILGLGDRHLDNILIKPHNGHLVHVDFSIIFDKGATLRIPEKVPFRLTQNFTSALQKPGVYGSFSVYLDEYLSKMKKYNQIALFTLKNIALSNQLEEYPVIDTEIVLKEELKTAISLLILRNKYLEKHFINTKKDMSEANCSLKNDISNSTSNLLECEESIEKLTIALTVLKDKEFNIEELIKFRKFCEIPLREEEFKKALLRLKERIMKLHSDYEESISLLPILDLSIKKDDIRGKINELGDYLLSSFPSINVRTEIEHLIRILTQTQETSKLVLQTGIIGNRFPFTCHRLFEMLEHVLRAELSEDWADSCSNEREKHNPVSVLNINIIIGEEIERVNEQIRKLKEVTNPNQLQNIVADINNLQDYCFCTEEMLARYTKSPSDFPVFISYAVPLLTEILESHILNYDFIARIIMVSKRSDNYLYTSKELPDYKEILLELPIKARSLLPLILNGNTSELITCGQSVIANICLFLSIISSESTTKPEQLTKEWADAVENVSQNAKIYDSFIKNENPNWRIETDILTFLLGPINNFTVPLTLLCESTIVNEGKKLVMCYNSSIRSQNPSDPMIINLKDLESTLKQYRFLKDLTNGLKGCEASRAWLASEQERFEWAHMNYLPNAESLLQAKSTTIKQIKSQAKALTTNISSIEKNVDNFPFEIMNCVKSSINYINLLDKAAQGIYSFEGIRFSPTPFSEFKELCRRIGSLAKEKKSLNNEYIETEIYLSKLCNEMMNDKEYVKPESDLEWSNLIEKYISSSLQVRVQTKFTIAEEKARLLKEESEESMKLQKKINRLRRLLANIDPMIQFIALYSKLSPDDMNGIEKLQHFRELVFSEWNQNIHFWSHMKLEQLIPLKHLYESKFQLIEELLGKIMCFLIENEKSIILNTDCLLDPRENKIDQSKVVSLVNTMSGKLLGFNTTASADTLIAESIRHENLAQMFEGWTPWV